MKDKLFPFQEQALADLHSTVDAAHMLLSSRKTQIISFSAPTGAGKTIMMTQLFEELLFGDADHIGDPDSIFIWISDSPELNEQTRMKIETKSDRIPARNLITLDANFTADILECGHIYFLNTQKLGSDKLLVSTSDKRQTSIWTVIENTATQYPSKLYCIIDEAHRGTAASEKEASKAQSIMQKFIKGSPDDGLSPLPLTIGMTATPQKFNALVSGITSSTMHQVVVPPEDVRSSGLLKDRIILRYPTLGFDADMSLFKASVEDWKKKCALWQAYYDQNKDGDHHDLVKPILVVQVTDGSGKEATGTDLTQCLDIWEEVTGSRLLENEVVHTFNDYGTLSIAGTEIHKVEPSRIQEREDIKLVFFKMNLSTGWDCPRAETMMSYRSAHEYTFIAQLLGRMVRTPLAHRIKSIPELNDVSLFLPFFDSETVKQVVKALEESDNVSFAETGSEKELVTYERENAYADVFDSMGNLITYSIDSSRKQSPLKSYMLLAHAISSDGIDVSSFGAAKNGMLDEMDKEIADIKSSPDYDSRVKAVTGLKVDSLIFDYGDSTMSVDTDNNTTEVSEYDIARHFEQAGKRLGEGMHREYWKRHADDDYIDVQIEVIMLADNTSAMERLEKYAELCFLSLYDNNRRSIGKLSEEKQTRYDRLVHSSVQPVPLEWKLPKTIDFTISETAQAYQKHLFCEAGGSAHIALNTWESGVLKEEIDDAVCWLRNLDRKTWSLEIPYEVKGVWTPMYPDLVIVRADSSGYIFDILEPHDPSRKDNCPKAIGLAKFAEKHGASFGRIELIREQSGVDGKKHFYRLDMGKIQIRNKVRAIKSNDELDAIFEEYGERKI